jgi:hypothetical protein
MPLIPENRLVILPVVRDFQISIAPNVRGFCLQGLGFRYQSQRRSSAISKATIKIAVPLVDPIDIKTEEEAHETS